MTANPSTLPLALTPTQRDAARIIDEISRSTGSPPTMRELANEMDLGSTSGAHRLVHGLIDRGWATAKPNCNHTLRLLYVPAPLQPAAPALDITDEGRAVLASHLTVVE